MLSNFEIHLFVHLGVLGKLQQFPNTYCAVGVAYGAKVSGKKAFLVLPIMFSCVSQYLLSKK